MVWPEVVLTDGIELQSSAAHLVMPTWIGVQMATITMAAVMGSIAYLLSSVFNIAVLN